MKELIINQIVPIIIAGIVAILVKSITVIGDTAIQTIAKKKEEIEQNIKVSGHKEQLTAAKDVWNIVEEKFRITENALSVLGSKADMFDELLIKKIPGLTKEELSDLRQSIAGEANKGKAALTDTAKLQQSNAQLQQENATLKAQLNTIQSAVNSTQGGTI